jgi:hypothetical protein
MRTFLFIVMTMWLSTTAHAATLEQLNRQMQQLNTSIGSYPPSFESSQQQQYVQYVWATTLAQAIELSTQQNLVSTDTLALLANLYRQGHNMSIEGMASKAHQTIQSCLAQDINHVGCNFAASYFYLSVNPQAAPMGEQALLRLKAHFAPTYNAEVERGLVMAYLFQKRQADTLKQLEVLMAHDPLDTWASTLYEKIKADQVQLMFKP